MNCKTSAVLNFVFLMFLISACFRSEAQFNDSIFHLVNLHSTGTYAKTNDARSYVLNNLVKFGYVKSRLTLQLTSGWIYGEQSGSTINNDYSTVFEFDFLKQQRKLYYWGMGNFDKSYSLKIDYRFQAGAGLGYNFVRNEKMSLILSDGLLYERGDLTDSELGQVTYGTWRNSLRLKYRWVTESIITLDGSAFVQHSLSDIDDVIIKSSSTLSVRVKKWISITASLTYNRITSSRRENLIATYGIVLERYF